MARGLAALLAALAALGLAPALAGARDRPARVIPYSVSAAEVPAGRVPELRAIVAATLGDPRGWALGGRVRFREVGAGGRFQVVLAAPRLIAGYGGCSAYYSCAPGALVLINDDRWMTGAPTYPGESWRHTYRQMVVNHEVGHVLGFGHVGCGRRGAAAPVMQQQSKSLAGCARNAWPLPSERRLLAARLGVRAARPPAPFAVGRRAAYVALGARRADVRALLGAPRERRGGALAGGRPRGRRDPAAVASREWARREGVAVHGRPRAWPDDAPSAGSRRERPRRLEIYGRPPVRVTYADGLVIAVTSRSPEDVDRRGAGVGARVRAVRRAHAPTCDGERCVLERGRRRTTFTVRDGRVAAVRVERLPPAARLAGPGSAPWAAPAAFWFGFPCARRANWTPHGLAALWAAFSCDSPAAGPDDRPIRRPGRGAQRAAQNAASARPSSVTGSSP